MALAVTAEGHRDILGLWAGDGGEGAKHWLRVLSEFKNRGVEDVLMLVCDGLKGLPDAVGEVWPRTVVQTCVVHLLRASFRYAARQDWDKIAKALKPVYTAPTEDAATTRFLEFAETWGKKYPAIVRLWESNWPEFTPFRQFDAEIRRIVCTTNSIESVNARIRKAVRARGHFPTEQAALKCVYMAVMSLDPTGAGRKRWTMRWKGAMNAFDLAFDGRLTAGQLQPHQTQLHRSSMLVTPCPVARRGLSSSMPISGSTAMTLPTSAARSRAMMPGSEGGVVGRGGREQFVGRVRGWSRNIEVRR